MKTYIYSTKDVPYNLKNKNQYIDYHLFIENEDKNIVVYSVIIITEDIYYFFNQFCYISILEYLYRILFIEDIDYKEVLLKISEMSDEVWNFIVEHRFSVRITNEIDPKTELPETFIQISYNQYMNHSFLEKDYQDMYNNIKKYLDFEQNRDIYFLIEPSKFDLNLDSNEISGILKIKNKKKNIYI